tara:strand:- start:349 stop:837 length:489 start_codon:yes stop_codon:yes gene_type:complete
MQKLPKGSLNMIFSWSHEIKILKEKVPNINLCKIGSTVQVDPYQINDRLPDSLYEIIKNNPIGEVVDYKMTDATGIGVIVRLTSGQEIWFFSHELLNLNNNLKNKKNYSSNELEEFKNIPNLKDQFLHNSNLDIYSTTKTIKELISPIRFVRWLIYSSKDIV